jgi:ankyrin repeat protein
MNLFEYIRKNNKDLFYMHIDSVDINQTNEQGQNMLHEAIAFNNKALSEELIKRKINVNHQDEKLQTPLHYVANYNNSKIAKLLLNNHGDLNVVDKYRNSPLWTATFNARGSYEIIKLFLKYFPDINHKNNNNKSPLDFARKINDKELIDLLKYNK